MTPKPESETDPWAKIAAFLDAIDEIAAIGSAPAMPAGQHTSPPAFRMTPSTAKNLKWNTREIRAEVDAAQAAEAAQHQQERNKLVGNVTQVALANLELRARLTAVEAERDKAIDENIRLTNAESEALRAERDRLKAALQDAVYTIAGWRTGSIGSIGNVHVGSFDVEHLARLRAVLTSQGQSTDGETR